MSKSPCPKCGKPFDLHKFGPKKKTLCPQCRKIRNKQYNRLYMKGKNKIYMERMCKENNEINLDNYDFSGNNYGFIYF